MMILQIFEKMKTEEVKKRKNVSHLTVANMLEVGCWWSRSWKSRWWWGGVGV